MNIEEIGAQIEEALKINKFLTKQVKDSGLVFPDGFVLSPQEVNSLKSLDFDGDAKELSEDFYALFEAHADVSDGLSGILSEKVMDKKSDLSYCFFVAHLAALGQW